MNTIDNLMFSCTCSNSWNSVFLGLCCLSVSDGSCSSYLTSDRLEIGEIEGLELDPELEGLLWENIVDILGLVNRLEDLQI